MKYLAIDLGDARTGIAVSESGIIATGLETYKRAQEDKDLQYIADLVKAYKIDVVVFGLPLNMDGTEGERVEKTKAFADKLQPLINAKIDYEDERLTTVVAEEMLIEGGMRRDKRKKVIDKIAATIILQSYLDRR
ncbi:MAG: Holliday junction resolvase RuvX [Clostridia bacterium]|nr:Holliday junction resolvase RuvX [Clostridia bacterium]MDE7079339.1 Holliday junction resolvase RuvX [Clostridia bacterium]